ELVLRRDFLDRTERPFSATPQRVAPGRRQEDEVAADQRDQGFLVIHTQEAGAAGDHQADALLAGKPEAPRGRELQAPVKLPLRPEQVHRLRKYVHYVSPGVLRQKSSVLATESPAAMAYYTVEADSPSTGAPREVSD